ncbi:MAG: hypothetical protein KA010_04185, partial [Saprospiraceae bacterium]|nr:hypothetical protein [Saprospiraceae bacterium]
MKNKFLLSIILILAFFRAGAQDPVQWSHSIKQVSDTEYEFITTATIKSGWSIYSQFIEGDDGPIPTSFEFSKPTNYKLIGKAVEGGHKKTVFDNVFGMNLTKFTEQAIFTQKIQIIDPTKPTSITGYVEAQACDSKSCLPPLPVDFNYSIPAKGKSSSNTNTPQKSPSATDKSNQTALVNPPNKPSITSTDISSTTSTTIKKNGGQELSPVKWTYNAVKISENEYDLVFNATINKGWNIYSQIKSGEDGPIPTTITFKPNKSYQLIGKPSESGNKQTKFDPIFGVKLTKFSETATFKQRVKTTTPDEVIEGNIDYMSCDDAQCVPLSQDFAMTASGKAMNTTVPSGDIQAPDDIYFQGFFDSKRDIDAQSVIKSCETPSNDSKSLWGIFILGFLGGLLALLTPCVFPMIPLTVSFFTKSSGNRAKAISNSIIYGVSIIVIYLIIGIILTSIFGPTVLNEMATDMYFNLLFFVVFVIFAISFFGYFEITLPSSWANSSDKAADKGGLIGIFFMAFTLALVSFSCTGPLIGTLLVQAVQNVDAFLFGFIPLKPLIGMFGFSLALALPFALFAAFPSWLNSLPKSGSWMTNVKVTLGFLELALALKFLSTADMVRHWGIMKFELFIAIWIVLFSGLALYQFGFIRFPHDSPVRKLNIGRWIVGTASVLFVCYLSWGLYNYQSLSLLSGLAPPVHYNYFRPMDCPHGLDCYK